MFHFIGTACVWRRTNSDFLVACCVTKTKGRVLVACGIKMAIPLILRVLLASFS